MVRVEGMKGAWLQRLSRGCIRRAAGEIFGEPDNERTFTGRRPTLSSASLASQTGIAGRHGAGLSMDIFQPCRVR